jgi:gliding motility-associated-like protein
MKQSQLRILLLMSLFVLGFTYAKACHGVALVAPTFTNTGSSIIVNASSDPATCGCGPYYMEVEVACFSSANFTGNAPACNAATWGTYPWYHGLLNVPNYTAAAGWPDNCVTEPYSPVTVPFAQLCPGTQYVLRARERVCAGSTGPWTSVYTFTTPGIPPTFSLTATASPNVICPGNPVTLTATINGSGGCGSGTPTFTWTPGNLVGQTVTVNPTTTTVYTVTATGGFLACYSVPPATVQVTVGPNATVGTASLSPSTVCQGGCVTLSLSSYNGTIQWQSSPNGITWTNIAGATTSPYVFCPVNSSMYFHAVVTGPAGCGTATSNTIVVGIIPVPTLSINPAAPSICSGQSVTLNVTGSSGYTWNGPSGSIGTGSSVTVSPTVTTTYTVSTSATCPATQTVTVTVNPLPVITFNPNNPAICAGTSVTIDAGPSTANYTWNPASGLTYLSAGQDSVLAAPLTTTSYNVTATTAAGCSSSSAITVTVNPTPLLVLSADTLTICPNTTDTITISGASTYTWNPMNGATLLNANGSQVEFGPSAPTTYTVVGTTASGCTDSTTVFVNITNNIVVDAGLPDSICPGQSTQLHATGGTIYAWTPNNASIISGANTDTPTVTPSTTTTFTVNVANQYGCTGVDSVTVLVRPLPAPNAGIDTGLCYGSSIDLNGSGGGTYSWNGSNIVSGAATATATINPAASGDYTLTVTDAYGCQNNDTVHVTVHPTPTANAGADQFICGNNCATLTATGGSTYVWSPVIGLSTPNAASTQACPQFTTTYAVTVTDVYGCTDMDSVKVVVYPPLNVVASVDDSICPGGQSTLSATAGGGDGGPYYYSWSPASGLGNAAAQTTTASPTVTTTYTVTITDACGSIAVSDSVTITVFSLPVVSVTPDVTEGCAPLCVTFTGNSNPAASSGTIDFGDQSTSATSPATHCYPLAGNYTIIYTVTDINGCSNSITYPGLITVHPVPQAGFTLSPQVTSILSPDITVTPTCINCDTTIYFMNGLTDTVPVINLDLPFLYSYNDTGYYPIVQVAVNQWGCIDTAMDYVIIQPDWSFFAPNAFTPNNDGRNDLFMVYGEGIDNNTFEMYIFDRWGNPIFTSKDMYEGWNGRVNNSGEYVVQVDTYVWRVRFRNINGEPHSYVGHVNVIR